LAKEAGLVSFVKPYIDQLKQIEFHLSDALMKKALDEAGE